MRDHEPHRHHRLRHKAVTFSQLAAEIEGAGKERYLADYKKHSAFVLAAIIGAAAFLEACINEFLGDAAEMPQILGDSLSAAEQKLLAAMWAHGVPRTARFSILEKGQIALALLGRSTFDLGQAPAQDAKAVIDLRNALVHFEPENQPLGELLPEYQNEGTRFEKLLRGKFSLNPHVETWAAFFPARCLSSGCTSWAVSSVVALADEFCRRVGTARRYDATRPQ